MSITLEQVKERLNTGIAYTHISFLHTLKRETCVLSKVYLIKLFVCFKTKSYSYKT